MRHASFPGNGTDARERLLSLPHVPEEFRSAGGGVDDVPRDPLLLDGGQARHIRVLPARKAPVLRVCGSYLVFLGANYPDEVSINTASFDDPAAFPPRMHIFAESRLPWFHIADELPSHTGFGGFHPADAGSQADAAG